MAPDAVSDERHRAGQFGGRRNTSDAERERHQTKSWVEGQLNGSTSDLVWECMLLVIQRSCGFAKDQSSFGDVGE